MGRLLVGLTSMALLAGGAAGWKVFLAAFPKAAAQD